MNQFIDDFYDVLFRPATGMERVVGERPAWQGLLVYLIVSLISTLTALSPLGTNVLSQELVQFLPQETVAVFLRLFPFLSLASVLIFAPFLLAVWSAVLHMSSELLGGRGRALRLLTGIGYAQLPYLFTVPLVLLSHPLQIDIVGLAGLAALIWSMYLKVEAIRVANSFSRRRAVLAYFLPVLFLIAALIIFFLLLTTILMPLFLRIA